MIHRLTTSSLDWLIASLSHWFMDSPLHSTHSLIYCFTASLMPPIPWVIDWLIRRLIYWFIASFLHRFTDSLVHRLTDSLLHWFIDSFIQLCLDSFMSFHWHLNNHLLICWCATTSTARCFACPGLSYTPPFPTNVVLILPASSPLSSWSSSWSSSLIILTHHFSINWQTPQGRKGV